MANPTLKATVGSYQYFDGTSTEFVGLNGSVDGQYGSVGTGLSVATDYPQNAYGLWDITGKVKYNKHFDSNIRIRSAFDDELKSTQIRISPLTVTVPINEKVSIYSNTHYSGKYNYQTNQWKHSMGNFTGVSYNPTSKDNLSLEIQRYNMQDITDNRPANWGVNIIFSHKI